MKYTIPSMMLALLLACGRNSNQINKLKTTIPPSVPIIKTLEQKNKEKIVFYQQGLNEIVNNFKSITQKIENNEKLSSVYKLHFDIVDKMLSGYDFTEASIISFEQSNSKLIDWANSNSTRDNMSAKLKGDLFDFKEKLQKSIANWDNNVLPSVNPGSGEWINTFIAELTPYIREAVARNIKTIDNTIQKIDSVK